MFTSLMYERLSEWTANVSVLFLGSAVIPLFTSNQQINTGTIIRGGILTLACLWVSLRLTRLSGGRG